MKSTLIVSHNKSTEWEKFFETRLKEFHINNKKRKDPNPNQGEKDPNSVETVRHAVRHHTHDDIKFNVINFEDASHAKIFEQYLLIDYPGEKPNMSIPS